MQHKQRIVESEEYLTMGHKPMGSGLALSEQEQQCLEAIRAILSEHGAIPAFQSGLHKYLNAAKAGSEGRSQCYLGKLSDLVAMSTGGLREHIEAKLAKRGWLSKERDTMSEQLTATYKVSTIGLEDEIEAVSFQDAAQQMLEKHHLTSVQSIAVEYSDLGTIELLGCRIVDGKLTYDDHNVIEVKDETQEAAERLTFLASGEAIEDQ